MSKLLLIFSIIFISCGSFSQSRYISTTTKKIVFTRDGGKCQCCGGYSNLEYDHVVPFSCGGSSEPSNIQLLCLTCNRSKSNSCYCKVHNRKVGINCCDGKTSVRKSSPGSQKNVSASSQCTGTTKKGARCRNRTTNSSGRCYLH